MISIGVLVASPHLVKFFITKDHGKTIDFLEELANPAVHHKSQDFKSDKEGHFYKSKGIKSAYEEHIDPKEYAIIQFAHEVTDFLNEQLKTHAMDKILI